MLFLSNFYNLSIFAIHISFFISHISHTFVISFYFFTFYMIYAHFEMIIARIVVLVELYKMWGDFLYIFLSSCSSPSVAVRVISPLI